MRYRGSVTPFLVIGITGLLLLWIWTRFAELWLPSVAFYLGLVVLLAGAASLLIPLRPFGIRSRRSAGIVALAGAGIAVTAFLWPVESGSRVGGGDTELDRVMPQFDRTERHEMRIQASVERVRLAAEMVAFSDIRGLQTLRILRARRFVEPNSMPVLSTMTAPRAGFAVLANTAGEFVAGSISRPWLSERPRAPRNAEDFRTFATDGYVKIAFNVRVEPYGEGWSRVSTETRIVALGDDTRRTFTRYWKIVYPGSALIRSMWLDAIQHKLRL